MSLKSLFEQHFGTDQEKVGEDQSVKLAAAYEELGRKLAREAFVSEVLSAREGEKEADGEKEEGGEKEKVAEEDEALAAILSDGETEEAGETEKVEEKTAEDDQVDAILKALKGEEKTASEEDKVIAELLKEGEEEEPSEEEPSEEELKKQAKAKVVSKAISRIYKAWKKAKAGPVKDRLAKALEKATRVAKAPLGTKGRRRAAGAAAAGGALGAYLAKKKKGEKKK